MGLKVHKLTDWGKIFKVGINLQMTLLNISNYID